MKRRTIGIVGGAFDCVHLGHLKMGQCGLKYVDEIWFQPCYSHMYSKKMIGGHHRSFMLELGVQEVLTESARRGKARVSNYEIEKKLELGSYEILCKMREDFPDYDFSLIVGQDNANTIHKWKNSEDLKRDFPFIVFPRNGAEIQDWYLNGQNYFASNDITASETIHYLSSTDIRKVLGDKHRHYYLNKPEWEGNKVWATYYKWMCDSIPLSVMDYISAQNLYHQEVENNLLNSK